MNEFITQKLGEVMAFARIGTDTLQKGKEGFRTILAESDMEKMQKTFKDLEKNILTLATEQGVEEDMQQEAKETEQKVTDMRDTYISGKWNEESELLEWMGFYSGASLVHWKLISGAAQSMKYEELETVSRQAIRFYSTLLILDEKVLQKFGATNAAK